MSVIKFGEPFVIIFTEEEGFLPNSLLLSFPVQ